MRHLKKQPVAILLALILVAGSVFLGVNRSVSEQVAVLKEQFYNGVFDPAVGYVRPGIHGQLTQRTTATLRMLTIGAGYHHADEAELRDAHQALEQARSVLLNLLTAGAGPSALFVADQAMTMAVERYYALLHPLILADEGEDLQALESANDTVLNAARVIQQSGYNEAVGAFHRTVLGQFPMTVLREIVFVQMPELFA